MRHGIHDSTSVGFLDCVGSDVLVLVKRKRGGAEPWGTYRNAYRIHTTKIHGSPALPSCSRYRLSCASLLSMAYRFSAFLTASAVLFSFSKFTVHGSCSVPHVWHVLISPRLLFCIVYTSRQARRCSSCKVSGVRIASSIVC